jgi:arylsulfatase A-like enzyme
MASECHVQALALDQHDAGKKPDIVFILVDNLGYGELGVYGEAFFVVLQLRA